MRSVILVLFYQAFQYAAQAVPGSREDRRAPGCCKIESFVPRFPIHCRSILLHHFLPQTMQHFDPAELVSSLHEIAQYQLGRIYGEGKFIEQNVEKAVKLFKSSSDQGYYLAQYSLGLCYLNGNGIDQSALLLPLNERKRSFLEKGIHKAIEYLGTSAHNIDFLNSSQKGI